MTISAYIASLSLLKLAKNLPGGIAQGLIWGLMALGVLITFRLLDVADLTVDGSFTLGAAVTVMLIIAGWPAWLAMLVAVIAGILAGLCTGLLHVKLGIPVILAGILTQFSLYSINLRIMGMAANKALSVDKYNLILSSRNITSAILTSLVIAFVLVCVFYWYFGTEQGSALRATGSNPAMSRALGIDIGAMKILGLAISNGVVALSGGLMSQYQGFADINMGRGAIVIGLAAVIIGEVLGKAILGKHLNFFGTMSFVVIGGVVTALNTLFSHLVRAEGRSMQASIGIMLGGILNMALDPLFMFVILPRGNEVVGAALATMLSNVAALIYFIIIIVKNRRVLVLSAKPEAAMFRDKIPSAVISIGIPACLMTLCENISYAILDNLMSLAGTAQQAGIGVAKKVNMLAHCIVRGMSQGVLPLIGYNYAAKKFKRTEDSFRFGCIISLSFALFCVVIYEIFAPGLASLFIKNEVTVKYAAAFLRRMVLAMPLMSLCYPLIIKFQAMGKAKESITVSILRKGVLDIPLYFMMDALFPLYGCMWVQPIVDTLSLGVAAGLNRRIVRHDESTRLEAEKNAE